MKPFLYATRPPHQGALEPGPDIFIRPAKFHSVRKASTLDHKRYLPWNKNGWKLEVDTRREFLYTFGEHPENPAIEAVSGMLRACRERQRMATSLINPTDAIVREHALNLRGECGCMLCKDHVQLARDMKLYMPFEERLILKAIHRIEDPKSHFTNLPPATPTHLEPYPHYIEETISGDVPVLRRAWEKELRTTTAPGIHLYRLIEEYLHDYDIPPETIPLDMDTLELLLQEWSQDYGAFLLRDYLVTVIAENWAGRLPVANKQQGNPPGDKTLPRPSRVIPPLNPRPNTPRNTDPDPKAPPDNASTLALNNVHFSLASTAPILTVSDNPGNRTDPDPDVASMPPSPTNQKQGTLTIWPPTFATTPPEKQLVEITGNIQINDLKHLTTATLLGILSRPPQETSSYEPSPDTFLEAFRETPILTPRSINPIGLVVDTESTNNPNASPQTTALLQVRHSYLNAPSPPHLYSKKWKNENSHCNRPPAPKKKRRKRHRPPPEQRPSPSESIYPQHNNPLVFSTGQPHDRISNHVTPTKENNLMREPPMGLPRAPPKSPTPLPDKGRPSPEANLNPAPTNALAEVPPQERNESPNLSSPQPTTRKGDRNRFLECFLLHNPDHLPASQPKEAEKEANPITSCSESSQRSAPQPLGAPSPPPKAKRNYVFGGNHRPRKPPPTEPYPGLCEEPPGLVNPPSQEPWRPGKSRRTSVMALSENILDVVAGFPKSLVLFIMTLMMALFLIPDPTNPQDTQHRPGTQGGHDPAP